MAATTSTTIRGVSILSEEKKRNDAFELVLSRQGIEVHRPARPAQQMSWDRVSEWEIEDRKGYVLLTLRGHGATTPLVIPGWTSDDLELLMREVTSGEASSVAADPDSVAVGADESRSPAAVAPAPVVASAPATPLPAQTAPASAAAPLTRAERRKSGPRKAGRWRLSWRVVATVVLLGVLAAAVILVLLQSAGVIDWSFLGPVA